MNFRQLAVPRSFWLLAFILIFFFQSLQAQQKQIEIKNSDELSVEPNSIAKKLIGNVILVHDNATMYCDSAYLYDAENKFEAFSRVRILQGDSMSLTSKHLLYEGGSKLAHADGNVVMIHRGMTINTERLDYDMKNKVADYRQKAKIVNGENTLYSQYGQYQSETKDLYFKKQVLLINPKYTMKTDTMRFNTTREVAYYFGPTTIVTPDKDTIYCENGWYDTRKDFAQFSKNAKIISGSQLITADSLTYDKVKGVGNGFRNIWFQDTTEKIILKGDIGRYNQKKRSAFITKNALAIQLVDSDSVYTHADTLSYCGDTAQAIKKIFLAYNQVKIYKSDIQSAADSMSYSFEDSVIRLYKNPIMWNKENQLTADTIYVFQKNNKADYMELRSKAFICSHERGNHYNQIKGKKIIGYFEMNELSRIRVLKDGESIYYIKEDSAHYTGINQISCHDMLILIKEKKVDGIKFYTENSGIIHPAKNADAGQLKLKGFSWQSARRPLQPSDVLLQP